MKRCAILLTLSLAALAAGAAQGRAAQDIAVPPVPDLRPAFMMGADVSMLDRIESLGGLYFDEKGKRGDCLAILKASGVNWIRLRIWNRPINEADVYDGSRLLSRAGDPVGGGNCDLASYIRVAARAKRLGLKVLADFHYSDFWADPGKQYVPAAWKGLGLEDLKKELYAFTDSCLKAMRAAKAMPDMVQVGNEIDDGMMWPVGKIESSAQYREVGGEAAFVALLSEAIRAVRDNDPARADPARRIRVMIHASNGCENARFRKVFDPIVAAGLDFDVIGLSYYPFWHGKLADLRANMADLAARYGKPMVIAETAYAYTLEAGDALPDSFNSGLQKQGGYKASVQGQASALRDVIAAVAGTPDGKGIGVFYWEPDWYPVEGAGWRTGDGSSWDNLAMFDFKGRALGSLKTFKLAAARKAKVPDLAIVSIDDTSLRTAAGAPLVLPSELPAAFNDDSYRLVQVQWDKPDPSAVERPGSFEVEGRVPGYGRGVKARVDVVVNSNLIADASFESGKLSPQWKLDGEGAAAAAPVEKNPGNARTGDWSFKYWRATPFKFTLSRRMTGLADGSYVLRAWSMGGGGEKDYYLYAKGEGAELKSRIANSGWQKWALYEIKGIVVSGGECEIGLSIDGDSGCWGNVDDVEFEKQGE
jgi:arabinogalactan endo-1,4-beta-galactosidase